MNDMIAPAGTATLAYDQMCRAIEAAYRVDEVKHIRDKAKAIEVYAAQANNVEAERQACEIRLRAERRCGQLLREREMAKRGPDKDTGQRSQRTTPAEPLSALGISRDQSSNWQKLAAIPDEQFERSLAAPGPKPTTTGLIAEHAEAKTVPVDDTALWLWGRLRDFERAGVLERDPNELVAGMLPHMQETTRQLAQKLLQWLGRIDA